MKKFVFLILVCSMVMTSCRMGKGLTVVPVTVPEEKHNETADTTVIPTFRPEVLYVLAREYEHSSDTLKAMGEYVEERLIEMYPEKAYRGMMGKMGEKAAERLQRYSRDPQRKEQPIDGLALAGMNEKYYNAVSDSAEVEWMDMSAAEEGAYRKLNELADSGMLGSEADFDSIVVFDSQWSLNRAVMSDTLPYFVKENWVMAAVSLGMATSTIYRILQSKARAEYVAKHYYGATDLGRKGDAYKHMFVNLLLTRYTTEAGAWLIMDVYWERKSWNTPADRIMDFHNNMVGRVYKYDMLTEGTNDWRKWALRLHDFVEDTTNNATYMDWHLWTPELDVKQAEKNSPKEKYIYWNKGDKTTKQYVDMLEERRKEKAMKLENSSEKTEKPIYE